MEVKILKCACAHQWQDKAYGPGMRVHNRAGKGDSAVKWRCTVCKAMR